MYINYVTSRAQASSLIRSAGLPARFTRAGRNVAAAFSFEADSEQVDEDNPYAQTATTRKAFYVSATARALEPGDVMTRDGETFMVAKVKEVRPAAMLVYQVVEVE